MQSQVLDNMDIERNGGSPSKHEAVRMHYQAFRRRDLHPEPDRTPGHVDFNYEVSGSLAACDGAVLVVDAAQGIEAQTLATCILRWTRI
jgi:GTP-binding protein LepA